MAGEERYLWLLYFRWENEDRIWWAYFKDWSEVVEYAALFLLTCPGLQWLKLEACPYGLKILGYHYAPTFSSQYWTDSLSRNTALQRDRLFFSLTPSPPHPNSYLVSFFEGLR